MYVTIITGPPGKHAVMTYNSEDMPELCFHTGLHPLPTIEDAKRKAEASKANGRAVYWTPPTEEERAHFTENHPRLLEGLLLMRFAPEPPAKAANEPR